MLQEDVTAVSRVERRCFANPWPASAYRRELRNRAQNFYVVLQAIPVDDNADDEDANGRSSRRADGSRLTRFHLRPFHRRATVQPIGPQVAGFAGMWTVFDEAHVTTIGVDPQHRGHGFGELLLLALIDEAVRRGATWVTLEVRVSNRVAQELYLKYGLTIKDRKRGYYSDDGEDAFMMRSRSLRDPAYLAEIEELRVQLAARLGETATVPEAPQSPWANTSSFGASNHGSHEGHVR